MLLLLVPGSQPATGAEEKGQVYGKQNRGELILRVANDHTRGFAPVVFGLDYETAGAFVLHTCLEVGLFVPLAEEAIAAPAWQGSRMIRGPPAL